MLALCDDARECLQRLSDCLTVTAWQVLDFGAGCGIAAWALDAVWPGEANSTSNNNSNSNHQHHHVYNHTVQSYVGVEPSRSMVDMGLSLIHI